MAIYTVCFMATGGMQIEADSEEEAVRKFNEEILEEDIIENLTSNGWDITEVFEEGTEDEEDEDEYDDEDEEEW